MRGEGARGGAVWPCFRRPEVQFLVVSGSGHRREAATLASGMKTFLIFFAAQIAAAITIFAFTRAASVHARFDGEWWHLEVGRRHYVLLLLCWCITLFFSAAPLIDPPETFGQYSFWTVLIACFWCFAGYATYQVFLIKCRWNEDEIRKFSWLSGWRFLLFRDLLALTEVEDGPARLTSKWGDKLRFDRTWNGAPQLIEACRRHIAANTAATAGTSAERKSVG